MSISGRWTAQLTGLNAFIALSILMLTGETVFLAYMVYSRNKHRDKANELDKELRKQVELKKNERIGRITVQQTNRELLAKIQSDCGYSYQPIAHVESPFPYLRGTPRQPSLVPSARGRIVFDKKTIQYEHYKELEQFSHIWIIFIFHNNTNTEKHNKVTKIRPPRLHGNKVGVLSTRSPHRPNNIGLSVCEVVRVCEEFIEVRGVDVVHGTPVLDVKPYIPYDIVPSFYKLPMATAANGSKLPARDLVVPEWIVETDIPLLPVRITAEAMVEIHKGIDQLNVKRPVVKSTISTVEEAIELITQVLRQDIRGVNQGRGNTRPVVRSYIEHLVTGGPQKGPGDDNSPNSCTLDIMEDDRSLNIYTCTLDMFHLQFETTDAEIVVHKISLSDNYTQLM